MIIANLICYCLVLLGAINWGLIAIFGLNLVTLIFGTMPVLATIVYVIIFIASIWLIITPFLTDGRVLLRSDKDNNR